MLENIILLLVIWTVVSAVLAVGCVFGDWLDRMIDREVA